MSFFNTLPRELIEQQFAHYMDIPSVLALCATCKDLHKYSDENNQVFWRSLFFTIVKCKPFRHNNWKKAVKNKITEASTPRLAISRLHDTLIKAINSGDLEQIGNLLRHKAAKRIVQKNGNRALITAMRCVPINYKLMQLLLDGGADVNGFMDGYDRTPLQLALCWGNRELGMWLINHVTLTHIDSLVTDSACGDDDGDGDDGGGDDGSDDVDVAVKGADVNKSQHTDYPCLSMTHDIEMLKMLLENGADPNKTGITASIDILYGEQNKLSVAQFLLEHGVKFPEFAWASAVSHHAHWSIRRDMNKLDLLNGFLDLLNAHQQIPSSTVVKTLSTTAMSYAQHCYSVLAFVHGLVTRKYFDHAAAAELYKNAAKYPPPALQEQIEFSLKVLNASEEWTEMLKAVNAKFAHFAQQYGRDTTHHTG